MIKFHEHSYCLKCKNNPHFSSEEPKISEGTPIEKDWLSCDAYDDIPAEIYRFGGQCKEYKSK